MKVKTIAVLLVASVIFQGIVAADYENADEQSLDSNEKTVLYVSLNGDDENDGTENSPFKTLTKARDTIRELKNENRLAPGGAVVYIREGRYGVSEGLQLTEIDSGSQNAPIVYRNYPGEKVMFVGGATIDADKFTRVNDESVLERIVDKTARSRVVYADLYAMGFDSLPEQPWPGTYSYWDTMPGITGKYEPSAWAPELIMNDEALTVARYPNDGYMYIESVIEAGAYPSLWSLGEDDDRYIKPEDRMPTPFTVTVDDKRVANWINAKDALLSGNFKYSWASQTVPLASVDPAKKSITSKYPSYFSVAANQYFYIYNLIEEIDSPGEYFVDRSTGKLYLYPPESGISTAIYTTLDTYMFELSNTSYITIKGIDMSYMRCGAVNMSNAKNCEVVGCDLSYTSKVAVKVKGSENRVYDCYIHNVSNGINLSGGDFETLTESKNVAENNDIEKADRISNTYSPGIYFSGVGNYVLHNKVHDAAHDLIQFSGNENVIAFNEIYDGCMHTDDMGAIYTGRDLTNRGNKILHNYIHDIGDVSAGDYGVQGIFLDDYWSAATMRGNVFENITGGAVKFSGSYNDVSNNLFINCKKAAGLLNRSASYGNDSNQVKQLRDPLAEKPYIYNDIWLEKYPTIANVVDEDGNVDMCNGIVAKNNVLYNTPIFNVSSDIAKKAEIEKNIQFESDPGFYDIEKGVYLLKEDSVVYEKLPDFEPILFTRMGTYSDRAIARVKMAYVLCFDSPYIMKQGMVLKNSMIALKKFNGKAYIPIRTAIETAGGELEFDSETKQITMSAQSSIVTFTDGSRTEVNLNGDTVSLKNPIENIDFTNYISAEDFADMFGKQLTVNDKLVVISDYENLFIDGVDDGLLRYLYEQLTVY